MNIQAISPEYVRVDRIQGKGKAYVKIAHRSSLIVPRRSKIADAVFPGRNRTITLAEVTHKAARIRLD
jgi:hypothetical protein